MCRPYFYPVLTPNGTGLTRAYPMEDVEGENQDHYHHRGIYTAHGLVNGHNLWDEGTGHGAMLQRGEPVVGAADSSAQIDGIVDWFGPEGEKLLEERRTIAIRAEGPLRIIDQRSEFRARYGDVTFGDTKGRRAVFDPGCRPPWMPKSRGGLKIPRTKSLKTAKARRLLGASKSAWVDYSGPLADGEEWGHTVVDHRDNPRHPTYWHVRGYGLFTANPFGVHDFKGDENIDESLTIPGGDKAVFRYRLIIHPGRSVDGHPDVRQLIEQFQAG